MENFPLQWCRLNSIFTSSHRFIGKWGEESVVYSQYSIFLCDAFSAFCVKLQAVALRQHTLCPSMLFSFSVAHITVWNTIYFLLLLVSCLSPHISQAAEIIWVFFFMFIYVVCERERDRACACAHMSRGGAEGEKETLKQAPCCQHRAWYGAWSHKPWDHDLSWNLESDDSPDEPPRHTRNHICYFNRNTSI